MARMRHLGISGGRVAASEYSGHKAGAAPGAVGIRSGATPLVLNESEQLLPRIRVREYDSREVGNPPRCHPRGRFRKGEQTEHRVAHAGASSIAPFRRQHQVADRLSDAERPGGGGDRQKPANAARPLTNARSRGV